jgi:hypothetical protein
VGLKWVEKWLTGFRIVSRLSRGTITVISWIKCYYVKIFEHMHLDLVSANITPLRKWLWKYANILAHGDIHMVVLAHLERRWTLRGREWFGIRRFRGNEMSFFYCAGCVNRRRSRGAEKHSSDAGYGSVGRWRQRPVFSLQRRVRTKWSSVRPTLWHRTLAKHCTASGGFVTSVASLNPRVRRTQWRPLTHRWTRPMSENRLWMLTRVHRTFDVGR